MAQREAAMRGVWLVFFWLILSRTFGVQAGPLAPEQVPEPLKPWVGWVLQGNENRLCPFLYNSAEERRCAWPTRLELTLDARKGSFRMFWQVQAESWVGLPGDSRLWPQNVRVNGKDGRVLARGDVPALLLAPGTYEVSGHLVWDRLPENLTVPRESGVIVLTVNGKTTAAPTFNEQGQLWIDGAGEARRAPPEVGNRLELQAFRRIVDEVPLRVLTHLELDVSGEQREMLLAGALLPEFIPMQLDSPLPARLEPDGRLRVQARPGRWQIRLTARHPGMLSRLTLPAALPQPWPGQEVWAFAAQPHLRIVEIEGVPAVDPRQTNLPEDWKNLPAYRVQGGETMDFKLIRRGDPEPEPDALNLRRNIWLDFDGGGYTLSDEISGRMTRDWRLNVLPGVQLGRVAVDGEPQLITRLRESGPVGVEVRRGTVRMSADSRFDGTVSRLPATGWDQDFRSVSSQLHLPPGWRLFAVTGVDNAPDTWIGRWTLLDLFLVLITTLAVARLWNWQRAAIALFALSLLWHEPGAPRYVWLNLLVAVALLRVLPATRAAGIVKAYRNLAAIALLLIALPFMVDQVRFGLYPQLELPWFSPASPRSGEAQQALRAQRPDEQTAIAEGEIATMEDKAMPAEGLPSAPESVPGPMRKGPARPYYGDADSSAMRLNEVDPGAVTQTGPGLPLWRWKTVTLSWNGPVLSGQQIGLFLLSPGATLLLNLLRVALLLALAGVVLGDVFRPGGEPRRPQAGKSTPGSVHSAVLLGLLLVLSIPAVRAAFPDQKLLDELKSRLLAPPDCLPGCAEIALLRLNLSASELEQRLDVHAQQSVAVPLPTLEGQWLPTAVSVDGAPAEGLFRSAEGGLWVHLKAGRHQIHLRGALPQRDQVQIPLPLKPHRVESAGGGWVVQGIGENGAPDGQLQLSRIPETGSEPSAALEPRPLSPFLEVRRTLQFGLDWRVATLVRRLSPADAPVVVEVPLLKGESVTTEGLMVRNGKALVNLVAGQEELGWDSVLEKRPGIALEAPETTLWTETWRLDVSPIWHLQAEGIAPAHHQDASGNWLPQWRPWPGETVSLSLTRPEGVPGNTLTVESSRLQVNPGRRAVDVTLNLDIRSSQGGQHTLRLPQNAALQSALVDGRTQPIRQQGRNVTLPIRPGQQNWTLIWREDSGLGWRYASPEVDLGASSVNSFISINLGRDRWVLLTGGPRLGPAVLFWGVLAVIVLLALGLGRIPWTPLKARQWGLLLAGLSQIPVAGALCVVGWLFALSWRARAARSLDDSRFNVLQLALAVLSLLALLFLFYAVQHGLLGLPDMQVAGNASTAYSLNWYQDHSAATLPRPWVLSLPLWTYRLLMLGWALWLAYSLLDWLRWGWNCFSADGLWRPRKKKAAPVTPAAGQESEQSV
jgi:hypothetical protein